MGVLGLWQLLAPTARTAKIEGLEGKVLAIDILLSMINSSPVFLFFSHVNFLNLELNISIWLYQATRGAKNTPNGHIIVLYNRICKLLYYKVKPIFVFDGPNVPNFKQRVLVSRFVRYFHAFIKLKDVFLFSKNEEIDKTQRMLKEKH